MGHHRPIILFCDGNALWTRRVRTELRRQGAWVLGTNDYDFLSSKPDSLIPDLVIVEYGLKDPQGGILETSLRKRWPASQFLTIVPSLHPGPRRKPGPPMIPMESEELLGAILKALPAWTVIPADRKNPSPLVLCVDDDRFYLGALARILGRHGYQTATFEQPESALEALPTLHPDLAILDILMPGMSGLDLAQEIRELTHDSISIVFLTARGSDDDIAQGYRCGGTYYLTKTCEPARVLNIVDYLIGNLDPDERRLVEAQL